MMMQWHKPHIETIFSIVPGETVWLNRRPAVVERYVGSVHEDLRPGREGRPAPMRDFKMENFTRK
jgi:hypothetical protein